MADIRCPMCGKDNPDHLEECQFCQARLTPLQAGMPSVDDFAPDGADDWLMALRADDKPESYEEEEAIPDWLRELGADDSEDPFPSISDQPEENQLSQELPDRQEQTQINVPEPDAAEVQFPATPNPAVSEKPSLESDESEKETREPANWIKDIDLPKEDAFSADTSGAEEIASQRDDVPDWLSELGSVDAAAPGDSGLDWLSDLGNEGRKIEADADKDIEGEDFKNIIPAWLSGISDEAVESETPAAELSTPQADDEDVPEWVAEFDVEENINDTSNLPDWIQEMSPVKAEEPAVSEPAEESLPDWLGEFEESAEVEAAAEEPAIVEPAVFYPAEEGLPDWLGEFEESAEVESAAEAPVVSELAEESLPDWLGEFEESAEVEAAAEAPVMSEPAEEGLPDWLGEFEEAAVEEPAGVEPAVIEPAEEGLPAWLQEMGQQAGEMDEAKRSEEKPLSASQEASTVDTPEKGEIPDWLIDFGEEPPETDAVEIAAAAVVGAQALSEDAPVEEGIPEWLQDLQSSPEADDQEELPALLSDVESESEAPAPVEGLIKPSDFISDTSADEDVDADEEQPEWLDDLIHVGGEKEEEVEEELPPWLAEFKDDEEDEVPEWLSSALGPVGDLDPDDTLSIPAPIEEELTADLDDWLANLNNETLEAEEEEGVDVSEWVANSEYEEMQTPEARAAEAPDWLSDLQDQSVGEFEFESGTWDPPEIPGTNEEEAEPDALDWMPEKQGDLSLDMLASGEGIEEGLSPGELPEWLKAMRPNESTTPGAIEAGEHDTGAIEKIGPLAGLRGVLSAEPSASQIGRTPSHFVRLQISETQQLKADQLQRMVSAETSPLPAKRGAILSEQRVLRYIIAALLFFIVVLPLFIPGHLSPLPARPVEMENLDRLISILNTNSHVLIGLDYQPGMSGEMDAAASSVVDHILLQRPKLALVSSQMTGPALGERLIHQVESQHNYEAGSQYVNLGYLPGDSTGLNLFAQNPLESTPLGYDTRPLWELLDKDANNPWQQPALQGIESLNDFDLTLLISDDPDTIRRWIEQVSPMLRSETFVIVSSAQAEPLVRPYFDAEQSPIVAFVPGLIGGAGYEGYLLREGPGRAAWDAFGLGSLMGIVLILGAGTYNLYILWKEREAERRGRR